MVYCRHGGKISFHTIHITIIVRMFTMKIKKAISVLCAVCVLASALPAASDTEPETLAPALKAEEQIELAVKNSEAILNTSPNRPSSKWELNSGRDAGSFQDLSALMTEYTDYYYVITSSTISCGYELFKAGDAGSTRSMNIILFRREKTNNKWTSVETKKVSFSNQNTEGTVNFTGLDTSYYYCIGFMNASSTDTSSNLKISGSYTVIQK